MTVDRIRDAVASGEYARAGKLFQEYTRTARLNEETLQEAADLVRWVRVTTLCAKAHAQTRLQASRTETYVLNAYAGRSGAR